MFNVFRRKSFPAPMLRPFGKPSVLFAELLIRNIGPVRQPGWLSHGSRKMLRILPVLYGICSIPEVIEQVYSVIFLEFFDYLYTN
jgi:hypothetical protein